jgi:hypothetical protein
MDETTRLCEYSVEAEVSPEFAWRYWTDIRNWSDPLARFSLDGAFATGCTNYSERNDVEGST